MLQQLKLDSNYYAYTHMSCMHYAHTYNGAIECTLSPPFVIVLIIIIIVITLEQYIQDIKKTESRK